MTAMNGIADVRVPETALAISRLEDGFVNMRGAAQAARRVGRERDDVGRGGPAL
ncbi:MAG: hypothetical protein SO057_10195 [Atopobiaceae bacterium]|nr:hypothetical protein [Atopobiaceae bacterium]